ncbi:hypothetical protein SAPIO_CDS1691 [Scedosporium apiospermum]|uniref:Uncharacterized protein n=1 Tax=Pseudallescheria apiosperma TaxID=563466 RepID=A0A084GDI9_PSEDA|nr:uncharacterized protein SAPIO_CDS1691 [Scedosporium apiospermum]KEZ45401.1 hypothetical protein SAPIO_CDS1691 [Scedosporium apiospermum]
MSLAQDSEKKVPLPSEEELSASIDPATIPEPLCTSKVLQRFKVVRQRNRLIAATKLRDPGAEDHRRHTETLKRLRKWKAVEDGGLWAKARAVVNVKERGAPKRPGDEELMGLVLHHFPTPGDVTVRVVDFYGDHSRRYDVPMRALISEYIHEKPEGVNVRWIYAPIGQGLIWSCLQDLFLNAGKGRKVTALGQGGKAWPYLSVEALSFRAREDYQQLRDIYGILSDDTASSNEPLRQLLNDAAQKAMGVPLAEDLRWRSEHLGMRSEFWDLVFSRVPYHLTQMSTQETTGGPPDIVNPNNAGHIYQTLWGHPSYRNAQLVRTMVRNYHRPDGMLLTMGPPCGVDYLDKDFNTYLGHSKSRREENEEASVYAFLYKRFEKSGTTDWPEKTVEWFLIYLITEIAAAPHNIRQGRSLTRLTVAYKQVVEKLKLRRYDRFRRSESIGLVRDFLTCQDELTCICNVLRGRLSMLETLKLSIDQREAEMARDGAVDVDIPPTTPSHETMCDSAKERVNWAISLVKEPLTVCEALLVDLRLSTEALFQLKSIEQNELAIVADSQNKAILVFTAVTVIFLPLSFFTSYFGMNLEGMTDLTRNEKWFWQVCGVLAFVIIFFTTTWAFREEIRTRLFGKRMPVSPHGTVM